MEMNITRHAPAPSVKTISQTRTFIGLWAPRTKQGLVIPNKISGIEGVLGFLPFCDGCKTHSVTLNRLPSH